MERGAPGRVALVTGVGRLKGIGSAIVLALAEDGWDIASAYWSAYDDQMPWGGDPHCQLELGKRLTEMGRKYRPMEADLSDPGTPPRLFAAAEESLGPVGALIVAHTESVTSGLLDSTIESFDRHYAVNVRATWLLIKEFGERFRGDSGSGRIVTLTSDHVAGNVPYGATKGAADRVTEAAAVELAHLGITANVVNPGPIDTGWMNDADREQAASATPLMRPATPQDAANLVRFLCSPQGGWINAQLLHSDGGSHPTIG